MLPDRGKPRTRDPWWRTLLLVVILLFIAGSVAAAGWVLARPQARVSGAAVVTSATATFSSSSDSSPAPAEETATGRRTIAATGLATIADDLSLPHENDPAWQGVNLLLEDCAEQVPRKPQGLAEASDVRTIQTGSADSWGTVRSETLAITADESAAAALYSEISALLTTCPTAPAGTDELPVASSSTGRVAPLPEDKRSTVTDWTQATIIADTFPQQDSPTEAQYVLLAQAGRALIIGVASGQSIPAPRDGTLDAGTTASLQSFADALATQLCRYKSSGCTVPDPGPIAFPQGSQQLPDGNILLPDGTIVQPDGKPVPTMSPTGATSSPSTIPGAEDSGGATR